MSVNRSKCLFLVLISLLDAVLVEALHPMINVPGCGKRQVLQSRVRGGQVARRGEHPWLVHVTGILSAEDALSCTGSIITAEHVLTASHCLIPDPSLYIISYGSVSLRNAWKTGVRFVFIPRETVDVPEQKGIPFEDALILLLRRPLKFNAFVAPVCLADESSNALLAGRRVVVAGYGATGCAPNKKLAFRSLLLKTGAEVVVPGESNYCKFLMAYGDEYEICVQHDSTAICQGDSGGPLLVESNDTVYLVGIASYMIANEECRVCPTEHGPQVFVRIGPLEGFIRKTMKRTCELRN